MIKNRAVDVLDIKENPDGSAVVSFDFNEEEVRCFFRSGVVEAIKRGIEMGNDFNPDKPRNHTFQMTDDQIDSIMAKELQDIYYRNMNPDGTDIFDTVDDKLLEACNTLLEYIMPSSEFDRWKDSLQ